MTASKTAAKPLAPRAVRGAAELSIIRMIIELALGRARAAEASRLPSSPARARCVRQKLPKRPDVPVGAPPEPVPAEPTCTTGVPKATTLPEATVTTANESPPAPPPPGPPLLPLPPAPPAAPPSALTLNGALAAPWQTFGIGVPHTWMVHMVVVPAAPALPLVPAPPAPPAPPR